MTKQAQTQATSQKAAGFTFGIEFETVAPISLQGLRAGSYSSGAGMSLPVDFPGNGWAAKSDCSIQAVRGFTGVEFVSPPLSGAEGLAEVEAVCSWFDANGIRVNKSCGTHVHIGYTSVVGSDDDAVANWAGKLVAIVAQYEEAIRGAAGSISRVDGRWCRTVETEDHKRLAETVKAAPRGCKARVLRNSYAASNRYHVLNLSNLGNGRKPTVEFRAFSGTTSGLKAVAWVQLCLALAERACGRSIRWGRPQQGAKSYGGSDTSAERSINRFFAMNGWKTGQKDTRKAVCVANGYIGDLARMNEVRAELLRLARKYDSQVAARNASQAA